MQPALGPDESQKERQWLEGILRKDEACLAAVIQRYQGPLFKRGKALFAAHAEDSLQHVWSTLWFKPPRLEMTQTLGPWLYRVQSNFMTTQHRQRKHWIQMFRQLEDGKASLDDLMRLVQLFGKVFLQLAGCSAVTHEKITYGVRHFLQVPPRIIVSDRSTVRLREEHAEICDVNPLPEFSDDFLKAKSALETEMNASVSSYTQPLSLPGEFANLNPVVGDLTLNYCYKRTAHLERSAEISNWCSAIRKQIAPRLPKLEQGRSGPPLGQKLQALTPRQAPLFERVSQKLEQDRRDPPDGEKHEGSLRAPSPLFERVSQKSRKSRHD